MSLINLLRKKSKNEFFTTPSHGQEFFIFPKLRQFYKYDISETDFHNPQRALESAEKKASEIYQTKSTHFLINGSTSGIITAVLACINKNDKVLIWDNAHPSHTNAVELAGGCAVFYSLEKDPSWGIYKPISAETLEDKLKNNLEDKSIKAIIITSPSYEGMVSEIKKLKAVCRKYGTYLIVDEAHGALYPFCQSLPQSAIYQGADFVIQSLHKTAGGLNPTALLHCNVDCKIKSAIEKITTTSPSYPLLASIEKNISYINSKKGRAKITELIKNIKDLKKSVKNCEFYESQDLTKILIKSPKMDGFELSEFLYKNGIEDERTNEISTMLLCGLGTSTKKLKKLERILKKI